MLPPPPPPPPLLPIQPPSSPSGSGCLLPVGPTIFQTTCRMTIGFVNPMTFVLCAALLAVQREIEALRAAVGV